MELMQVIDITHFNRHLLKKGESRRLLAWKAIVKQWQRFSPSGTALPELRSHAQLDLTPSKQLFLLSIS